MASPSEANGEAPLPLAPSHGHVFAWNDVEYDGVEFAVEGPPGRFFLEVQISRDARFPAAETISLYEEDPGRYEGHGLDLLYDEVADSGSYFWRPYYYKDGVAVYGAVRDFSIKPPHRPPSVRMRARPRMHAGKRYPIVLRYAAGSESSGDRLHLLVAERCPGAPVKRPRRTLLSDVPPARGGQVAVAYRPRRVGRVRLCAYVTNTGRVVRRATRLVRITKRPASTRQMLRWRLAARRLGPIKIGMTLADLKRVTGRSALKSYGELASCQIWSLPGAPGLSLMRSHGRIVRISVYRGRWRTSKGVAIGDRQAEVLSRYGAVRTQPHPYTNGKYLIVGGPRRRMIFETNTARRVTSFRGGRAPHIGYIEGCA